MTCLKPLFFFFPYGFSARFLEDGLLCIHVILNFLKTTILLRTIGVLFCSFGSVIIADPKLSAAQ